MAIKWDRLTVKSQQAVQAAQGLAGENGNPEVMPTHLLHALLEDKDGVVLPVLEKIHVPVQQLLSTMNGAIGRLPKIQGGSQPGLGQAAQRVLEQAFKEAEGFKDEYVSTEHILLAMTRAKGEPVEAALAAVGATHEAVLDEVRKAQGWR